MNDNETLVVRQPIIASTTDLSRVLTDALSSFETRRERYADN